MPRRVRKKPSLLAPAGDLIRRLSSENARMRRRLVFVGYCGVALFFVYSIASETYGVPRIFRLEMEKRAMADANRRQTAQLVDDIRERNLLLNDRNYIELIARTKYHMAYPNETIYRYRSH